MHRVWLNWYPRTKPPKGIVPQDVGFGSKTGLRHPHTTVRCPFSCGKKNLLVGYSINQIVKAANLKMSLQERKMTCLGFKAHHNSNSAAARPDNCSMRSSWELPPPGTLSGFIASVLFFHSETCFLIWALPPPQVPQDDQSSQIWSHQ